MSSLGTITLGIYEKALPATLAWPECLRLAAQAGYDFVEIAMDENEDRLERLGWGMAQRVKFRQSATDAGVRPTSMCLSAHRKYPMGSASPKVRQRGLDILEAAVDFAQDVGIRIILVPGYDVFYEPSDDGTQQRFVEGLTKGVSWASSAGVMLALENTDHSITSITQAMHYVREFNSPWLQLYADIGNLVAFGHDPETEVEAGAGHIAGVHIKDAVPGEFRGIPFGQGMVPFERVFRRLWQIGFCGPVMLEMWADDSRPALETITQARQWVWTQIEESLHGLPTEWIVSGGSPVEDANRR